MILTDSTGTGVAGLHKEAPESASSPMFSGMLIWDKAQGPLRAPPWHSTARRTVMTLTLVIAAIASCWASFGADRNASTRHVPGRQQRIHGSNSFHHLVVVVLHPCRQECTPDSPRSAAALAGARRTFLGWLVTWSRHRRRCKLVVLARSMSTRPDLRHGRTASEDDSGGHELATRGDFPFRLALRPAAPRRGDTEIG